MQTTQIFKYFVFLALLGFLTSAPNLVAAASWSQLPNYAQSINITVLNWTYNTHYIGITNDSGAPSSYVLVNLSKVNNPSQMSIYGYDSGGQNLGKIYYYLVRVANSITTIEFPSTTSQGLAYHFATVFYNKTTTDLTNNTYNLSTTNYAAGHGVNFVLVGYTSLPNPPQLTPLGSLYKGLCPSSTICVSSPFINTTYAYLNASLNTSRVSAFVVFASNQLTTSSFNITWFPNSWSKAIISNSVAGSYRLTAPDTINIYGFPFVTNNTVKSETLNKLLNTTPGFDSLGYEGYFNTNIGYDQVISEAMIMQPQINILGSTILTNSSAFKQFYDLFNSQQYQFSIKANVINPTTFYILPAFTTNYIIGNTIKNPNTVTNLTTNCTQFLYQELISNITFNSVFYTTANKIIITGDNLASNVPFYFNNSQVHYLLLNLSKYQHMGASCQTLGIYTPANQLVPFTVVNCSTSKVEIIVANQSINHLTFNSLYVKWGNPTNATTNLANSLVLSTWRFAPPQSSINSTIRPSNSLPFIMQLQSQLDTISNVILFRTGTVYSIYSYNTINNNYVFSEFGGGGAGCGYGQVTNPSAETQILFFQNSLGFPTTMSTSSMFGYFGGTTAYVVNASSHLTVNCYGINAGTVVGVMRGDVQAYDTYLYSTNYHVNAEQSIPSICGINNTQHSPLENSTIIVNKTITAQNLTNSTIQPNFSSNTLLAQIQVFKDFSVPYGIVVLFGIILLLLSSVFLVKSSEEIGVVVMILFIFLIGLLDVQIEIIAFIFFAIFLSVEIFRYVGNSEYKNSVNNGIGLK